MSRQLEIIDKTAHAHNVSVTFILKDLTLNVTSLQQILQRLGCKTRRLTQGCNVEALVTLVIQITISEGSLFKSKPIIL